MTINQQQGDNTIPTSRPLIGVRNLPLAQVSVARRHKLVIKVVPATAEEEESGGESEYFSAPSSPLVDRREMKRGRGDAESSQSSPAPDEGEPKCLETNRRLRNEQDEDEDENEDVQEITQQDWLKSVIETRPARSFNNLPDSIILQIVDTLHEQDDGKLVSSICFGLTCRRCWSVFKVRWCCPGWNMIYNGYLPKEDQALLAPLLQNWVPEKYRIMSGIGGKGGPSFVPMFLSKRQYGEGYTREEERLEKRYDACISILDAANQEGLQLKPSRGLHAMIDNTVDLPSPQGMGHSWYDASASEYLFLVEKWEYTTISGNGPGFKAICESWHTFKKTSLWDWVNNAKNFNHSREDWMDDENMEGRREIKTDLLNFDKKVTRYERGNGGLLDENIAGFAADMSSEDIVWE
ncbi:hypothetical protein OCU04_009910 [Sclerotinia nivalis]|uniref:Uncharacterized protein n=1 Tax=Sclerotinia nivalis TaxID=352851 RepID=A0A9X0DEQ8_9HELO|nr:hypothetical protein OCU04_009910 [Sclerotinia nivalis]